MVEKFEEKAMGHVIVAFSAVTNGNNLETSLVHCHSVCVVPFHSLHNLSFWFYDPCHKSKPICNHLQYRFYRYHLLVE